MQTRVIPVKKIPHPALPSVLGAENPVAVVDAHPFRVYAPWGGLAKAWCPLCPTGGDAIGTRWPRFLASPALPALCKHVLWALGAIAVKSDRLMHPVPQAGSLSQSHHPIMR